MPKFRLRHQASDFELPPGEFVIGRSTSCHLSLDDSLVSRRHAALVTSAQGVVVKDLESRNGIFVNGVKVIGAAPLKGGDTISIGAHELQLNEARDAGATAQRCIACEAALPEGATRCPSCNARVRIFSSTLSPNQTQDLVLPKRPAGRESQPEEETKRATITLEFITAIADKAIALGKLEEAERILSMHLEGIVTRRSDLDVTTLRLGTKYALDLADGLNRPRWLEWIFRAHQSFGVLPEAATVDRLYQLVRKVKYTDPRPLRAYLEVLAGLAETQSAADRFVMRRLEGLEKVIGA